MLLDFLRDGKSIQYYMLFELRSLDCSIPDEPQLHLRVPSAFSRLGGFYQILFSMGMPLPKADRCRRQACQPLRQATAVKLLLPGSGSMNGFDFP